MVNRNNFIRNQPHANNFILVLAWIL